MSAVRDTRSNDIILKGVSICPGIGIGRVHILESDMTIPERDIQENEVEDELNRYNDAVETAKHYLDEHIKTEHSGFSLNDRAIFNIHEMMLMDNFFHEKVHKRIRDEQKNAEWCLNQETIKMLSHLDLTRDSYFHARGEDIRDMAKNLLGILLSTEESADWRIGEDSILLTHYLHPSDVIMAHRYKSKGFASESNALVSHAAILIKGFGIPSVAGLRNLIDNAHQGDTIIIDGTNGLVIVRPSSGKIEEYQNLIEETAVPVAKREIVRCLTADGHDIDLKANIENPEQVEMMLNQGLNGIGLFRTEFFISTVSAMPSEEEQYKTYRYVIEKANGRPVTIRTFDIGGDKQIGVLSKCTGRNPSLGVRGIRRHLTERIEEFRTQLRAILRAAAGNNVRILIPMVTTVDDIIQVKEHLSHVSSDLSRTDEAFSKDILLGAMIETPAAAVAVDEILSEVDFISLGTNDLLQYFMAADRDNERVIHYNDASNPIFLKLLDSIIKEARKLGRERNVTICGETASDERVIPKLLFLGYRSFSISPSCAPLFRDVCAHFRSKEVFENK